jgi:hypothetical protein
VAVYPDSSSSRPDLRTPAASPQSTDELLQAVREAAAGRFMLLGEIGCSPDGTIGYLARDPGTGQLVVLRLTPAGGSNNEYLLEVTKHLDASVPTPPSLCLRCYAAVRARAKFCTHCGASVWSERTVGEHWKKEELLDAVRAATRGKFELLGEMSQAEGGIVYFVRDLNSSKIEALRVQQEGEGEYSIGLTGLLKRL